MKRRVLITGGAGFIGSNLKERLNEFDYEILTVGRSEREDVRLYLNDPKLKKIVSKFKPNIICHLASGSNIIRADKDREREFNDAVISTNNLIESLTALDISPKIIYLSSQTVYGVHQYLPLKESHSTNPLTTYGKNKLLVEKIITGSRLNYLILRVSSTYGLGQDYSKSGVVAKFINCMKNNQSPVVYNSFDLYFDFIYIKDLISALNIAIKKFFQDEVQNEIFNLGVGSPTSLSKLLEILYKYFPYAPNARLENNDLYLKKEQKGLYLDISKIKLVLGWQPKYNIENGLNDMLKEFELVKNS